MWNDVEPIVYNTWDVLTMWMPPGPFLPLTMLSVLERNMYLEIYFTFIQLLDTIVRVENVCKKRWIYIFLVYRMIHLCQFYLLGEKLQNTTPELETGAL